MKKLLLALAVLVVLVLVGALARLGLEPATSVPESTPASTSASSDPASLARPADELAKDETAPAEDARAQAADAEAIARSKAPADARWVTGRVVAPEGCPEQGRVVLALARELDWADLAGELDPRRQRDDGDEELGAAFGSVEEQLGRDDEPVISRADVAADGTFRVWFPAKAKRGWVALSGRNQYAEHALEIDLVRHANDAVTLRAECGACVEVRVTLPDGADPATFAADEIVELRPAVQGMPGMDRARAIHRRAKAEDGVFAFEALPVGAPYALRMHPDHFAAVDKKLGELRAGTVERVDVALRRGGTLRGRVRDPGGALVAGAVVRASTPGQWFGFDDDRLRSAKTGADGAFELDAVVAGKITLRADHADFLESEKVEVDLADGGTRDDVELVLGGGATIAGTLKWPDGKPAGDVRVRVSFDLSQMYGMSAMNALRGGSGKARTDAQGAFTVGGLGAGPFTVQAEAPAPDSPDAADASASKATDDASKADDGAKPADSTKRDDDATKRAKKARMWRARADGVAPGTQALALVLAPPQGLHGRVADETGAPVSTTFTLYAQRTATGPLASLGQEAHQEEFTDPAGAFVLLGLSAGTWKLTATAESFAPNAPLVVELPRAETAEELVIVVAHAARASGFVRDPMGHGVEGAEVAVETSGPSWQQFMERGPKRPKARSEADGSFVLEGLAPEKQKLVATARSFARSLPVEVDLAADHDAKEVAIVLRNGGTLSGEVFDDAGRPASNWMVQIQQAAPFDQVMDFTDGQGRFQVEHLVPGERQVVAMPSGSAAARGDDAPSSSSGDAKLADDMASFVSKMKMGSASIVDGEETHVVLGAPPKDPVEVSGRVMHAGAPYSGAMISFVRQGKTAPGAGGFKSSRVDEQGRYTVKLNEPGDYSVSVQKFQGAGNQQNVVEFVREVPQQPKATLDFELPTGRISGRVRDGNHDPVKSARISLVADGGGEPGTLWGGQYNETATDTEGRYDIQALRPGKYTVLAGGMSLGGMFGDDAAHGREAKSGLTLSSGEWMRDVDFDLKKPGTIDVKVVDDAGAAVSGASVFVRTHAGELVDRFSMLSSGSDGACKYGGLAPGRYTVSAREGTRASADGAEVEVREGEHVPARVVLSGGTYLIVSVVDGENKPLQASLSVRDEQGREVGAMVSLSELMKYFSGGTGSADERRVGPLPAGKYRVQAQLSDGRSAVKPVTLSGQSERKLIIRL